MSKETLSPHLLCNFSLLWTKYLCVNCSGFNAGMTKPSLKQRQRNPGTNPMRTKSMSQTAGGGAYSINFSLQHDMLYMFQGLSALPREEIVSVLTSKHNQAGNYAPR